MGNQVMQVFCCLHCGQTFSVAAWIWIHMATYHQFRNVSIRETELCCALLQVMVEMPKELLVSELGLN